MIAVIRNPNRRTPRVVARSFPRAGSLAATVDMVGARRRLAPFIATRAIRTSGTYLTPAEAAHLLGCGESIVRGLMESGHLCQSRIADEPGRPVKVHANQIAALVGLPVSSALQRITRGGAP